MVKARLTPQAVRRGLLVSIGISLLGIVGLNLRTINPATWGLLRRASLLPLAGAFLSIVLAWLVEAWRIHVLLGLLGERVRFPALIRVVLATFFAAGATPFASGQGPVQIYLIHREGPSVGKATALLSLRLLLTTLVFTFSIPLLLLAFRVSVSQSVHVLVNYGVGASFVLSALILTFILRPHVVEGFTRRLAHTPWMARFFKPGAVDRLLARLVAEVDDFTAAIGRLEPERLFPLIVSVLLTIVYWALYFSAAPLLLYAFRLHFVLVRVIVLQAVFFFLISSVPIPGGSGVAEIGFASIFNHLVPTSLLGVFVSLWRLVTYYFSMLCGAGIFFGIITEMTSGRRAS